MTTIPLVPRLLAGSSDLPGGFGRAVLDRHPIWSCSVRGFACRPCCHGRGALLPHLFTLTRLRPPDFGEASPRTAAPKRACLAEAPKARRRAVSFLCHYPSGFPARALPGALPLGGRTFLPRPSFGLRWASPVKRPARPQRRKARRRAVVWLTATLPLSRTVHASSFSVRFVFKFGSRFPLGREPEHELRSENPEV